MTPAEKMLKNAEARATAAWQEYLRAEQAVKWRRSMVDAERRRALRPWPSESGSRRLEAPDAS